MEWGGGGGGGIYIDRTGQAVGNWRVNSNKCTSATALYDH